MYLLRTVRISAFASRCGVFCFSLYLRNGFAFFSFLAGICYVFSTINHAADKISRLGISAFPTNCIFIFAIDGSSISFLFTLCIIFFVELFSSWLWLYSLRRWSALISLTWLDDVRCTGLRNLLVRVGSIAVLVLFVSASSARLW